MPWNRGDYVSPSALHLCPTPFKLRKFGRTSIRPVILRGRYAGYDLRSWFNEHRAVKRTFEVFYGYNPRCCHQGTWRRPGFGHWQAGKSFFERSSR